MPQWAFGKAGGRTLKWSHICHLAGVAAVLANLARHADVMHRYSRNTEQYSPTQRFERGCLGAKKGKITRPHGLDTKSEAQNCSISYVVICQRHIASCRTRARHVDVRLMLLKSCVYGFAEPNSEEIS